MRIGLVTDSPSDLPAQLVSRYAIQVVPAILVLDGVSYQDGVEISREEFYTRLPLLRASPTTAAPAMEDFARCYRQLFAAGCDRVIGIFTAEKLTSIASIARKASEEFGGQVIVIESGSLSLGIGFQVLAAAEAIHAGLDLSAVLAAACSARDRLCIFAALDTIDYLRRSGRVPQAVAALGGLLSIKPVIELREGVVKPVQVARTTNQATEKLAAILGELGPLERLSVLHTNVEQRACAFLEKIREKYAPILPEDILITNVTTVIGTHVGPNAIGIAAIKKSA